VSLLLCIDEEINGKAFRELTDENLKELGFKMGARINIRGIISSVTVGRIDVIMIIIINYYTSHKVVFIYLHVVLCSDM
jgi:hypothetical protein